VRRCRAHRVVVAIVEEEVVDHEHEKSDLVKSKLDRHAKSYPPTQYLEFNNREAQKLSTNVAREMALFTTN
jgi:hypothetical protein